MKLLKIEQLKETERIVTNVVFEVKNDVKTNSAKKIFTYCKFKVDGYDKLATKSLKNSKLLELHRMMNNIMKTLVDNYNATVDDENKIIIYGLINSTRYAGNNVFINGYEIKSPVKVIEDGNVVYNMFEDMMAQFHKSTARIFYFE